MKEIVQYHNDLNTLQIGGFTEKEMDIFFAICLKLKNKELKEVELSFSEIQKLIQYPSRNLNRLIKDLESTYDKMLKLDFRLEDLDRIVKFTLFNRYMIDKKQKIVSIRVNDDFKYILNDFMANYTKFDLSEFIKIKSTYAKGLFKVLKQFRNTGWLELSTIQFKKILSIPDSYKMSDIDKKVLKPILDELPKYFFNLEVEKIKKGRSIDKFRFTWDVNSDEKISVMPKDDLIDEAIQNKINAVKAAISILDDTEILALLDVADVGVILEKYYTLAVGKNIDNLTGFLMAAIKNDWKKTPKKAEEKKAVQGEMDELERKLQKRLFDKLNNRGN